MVTNAVSAVPENPQGPEIEQKPFFTLITELFVIYGRGFLKFVIPIVIVDGILLFITPMIAAEKITVSNTSAIFPVLLVLLLYWIAYMFIYSFFIHTAATYNIFGKHTVMTALTTVFRRFAKVLGLIGLILLISIGVGLCFLVFSLLSWIGIALFLLVFVPLGLYLGVKWAFIFHAVVIEGSGPGEAFSRSSDLTRGLWWRTFGIMLLIGVVCFGITLGLQFALEFLAPYSQAIISAIVTPISIIGVTLLYYDTRARSEHVYVKEVESELVPAIENKAN
jgi:hypothetical protein